MKLHFIYLALLPITLSLPNQILARDFIYFDSPRVVEARNITPQGHAGNDKIIEVILSPSFQNKAPGDILLNSKINIETSFLVMDFFPQNQIQAPLNGDKKITLIATESNGRVIYGKSSINTENKHLSSKIEFKYLPPIEVVVASGFTYLGKGLFYNFKKTDKTPLAGRKDVGFLIQVPQNFRQSCLTMTIEAEIEYDEAVFSDTVRMKKNITERLDVAYYLGEQANPVIAKQKCIAFRDSDKLDTQLKKAYDELDKAIKEYDKRNKEVWFWVEEKYNNKINESKNNIKKNLDRIKEDFQRKFATPE